MSMRGRCVLCLYQPALITTAQHPVMDPAQGLLRAVRQSDVKQRGDGATVMQL